VRATSEERAMRVCVMMGKRVVTVAGFIGGRVPGGQVSSWRVLDLI